MPDQLNEFAGEKYCRYCQRSLPRESFNVRRVSADGLAYQCRQCDNLASAARRIAKPEETRKAKAKCYAAKRGEYCDKSRQWASNNRKRRNEIAVNYVNRNREDHNARVRRYQAQHPEKVRAAAMKRHCAKLQRTPAWLSAAQLAEIEAFHAKAVSAELLFHTRFEVDHIVPLQGKNVSGLHVPWNLRVIPRSTNRTKGARHESDE